MKMKDYDIKDKNIILTGATGKLGTEYVKSFAECGAKTICIDVNKQKLDDLKKKYKDSVTIYEVDITNKNLLLEVSKDLKNNKLPVDGLVNNAAGKQTTIVDGILTNFENF